MTFGEAVKAGFDNYVKFDGRASRPEFWWWVLFAFLVSVAARLLDAALGIHFLYAIAGLGLFLPGLGVSIRRLHDTNRSGWWILIGLIPIIGFIVLLVFYIQESDAGDNQYGPPPPSAPPAAAPA
jgi:uncharacterized membrane protein YhaH (DUF805 family)